MTASTFKIWETNRKWLVPFFDSYTLPQLNAVPAGFSNSLIWNLGHIIVAQQSLIYRLSGLPMHISEDLFDQYKPGSQPRLDTKQEEVNTLKGLMTSLVASTKQDFDAGKFVSFTERTTSTGFELKCLDDAFEFVNYHEGMHIGMMMNIRKFV